MDYYSHSMHVHNAYFLTRGNLASRRCVTFWCMKMGICIFLEIFENFCISRAHILTIKTFLVIRYETLVAKVTLWISPWHVRRSPIADGIFRILSLASRWAEVVVGAKSFASGVVVCLNASASSTHKGGATCFEIFAILPMHPMLLVLAESA